MRAFACDHCANLVWFENVECLRCGSALGFDREAHDLVAMYAGSDGLTAHRDGRARRRCANADVAGCNWVLDARSPMALCDSCALTRTRPRDEDDAAMAGFRDAEAAKRRLLYQLDDLGLPVQRRDGDHPQGLAFDLLSSRDEPVITGHADGLITIDMAEGDDAHREALRAQMAEPYRTMLGHFRHETGHYYWTVLVDGTAAIDRFRELFGDERADYGDSLSRHYDQGPPQGWEADYVSAYATAHPWEDWAETFAHYLHIRDTLQTASSVGVWVAGPDASVASTQSAPLSSLPVDRDPSDMDELMASWLPLVFALNAIERSMGKQDLYPFVLAPAVVQKLAFVHALLAT